MLVTILSNRRIKYHSLIAYICIYKNKTKYKRNNHTRNSNEEDYFKRLPPYRVANTRIVIKITARVNIPEDTVVKGFSSTKDVQDGGSELDGPLY
jgi:hypothetical protein